jgi:hypothetical protein
MSSLFQPLQTILGVSSTYVFGLVDNLGKEINLRADLMHWAAGKQKEKKQKHIDV